jgi:hypothetical protein
MSTAEEGMEGTKCVVNLQVVVYMAGNDSLRR